MRDAKIEIAINDVLQWRPTFSWEARTEVIVCEVSDRPNFKSLKGFFTDITTNNLYIRIIVASPEPSSIGITDYRHDLEELKKLGIGYICITDTGNDTFEFPGIPLPLYITQPDYDSYKKSLRPLIRQAYGLYMGGDPAHGVQDLGQTVENIMYKLGDQAINKGVLTSGGYPSTVASGTYYPVANLIDDLMRTHVIDNGVLGRCRGFIDDRHNCSHRPKDIKEARLLVTILRNCWGDGLRILSELPDELRTKHYKLLV